jgi:hypothetical protein
MIEGMIFRKSRPSLKGRGHYSCIQLLSQSDSVVPAARLIESATHN